ncbi:MAG: peptide chain release factor N(5)-glutamine methyltransferase [Opitutaceae bacterium]|nr:peptide chain release factor N(5)-glutamine methyltransferase [Opitutaceae bacterium]
MLTVLEIIKRSAEFLAGKGVECARLNAELLIGHALGLKRMQLYLQFERPLAEPELEKIRPLVRRRGQREPLQHILGETEFHGLRLKTDRRALIPRPETELLVELVVARLSEPPRRLVDLGTGSGAIALALARRYPEAEIVATDASAEALALARENAALNGLDGRVRWLESDWFAALAGESFDVVVSNPPYLSEAEVASAAPEVRDHEPRAALTPGGDGLAALTAIIASAGGHLPAGGLLALETGIAQHATLLPITARHGFAAAESCPDLTGRERFVFARKA